MRESEGCSPTPARRSRSRGTRTSSCSGSCRRCPCETRPKLVSTDGEFHTLRRQLGRLAEEELEVVRLPARPVETLSERLAAEAPGASAVLVSAVLFEDSRIVPELPALAAACADAGAELLVDAYHALGCLPFTVAGLERAWIVGGGYKYLQLGEGNCFLRLPAARRGAAPGDHRLVRRVRGAARGARARCDRVPAGQHALRGLDVRPDEPLPRGAGVRLLRGAGPDARAPPRELPRADDAARRALRRSRARRRHTSSATFRSRLSEASSPSSRSVPRT